MKNSKKFISIILAIVLTLSCITCMAGISASAADTFTIEVHSNFFPARTETFPADTERVTVSYYIKSSQLMVNSQWNLFFDPQVLSFCEEDGTNYTDVYDEGELLYSECNISPVASDAVINTEKTALGEIHGNNSNANPIYSLKTSDDGKICFVTVTFDVTKAEDTEVSLELVELLTNKGQQYKFSDRTDEFSDGAFETQSSVYAGNFDPDYENQEPATEEPTTEPIATEEPTTEPATEEVTTEPVVADTYTVAGSSAGIFGTSWDATNAANDMTFNADTGLYEIVYSDVQPEDAIQLKVVKNYSWDESYPEDNYTFTVLEPCDVTVAFDVETGTVYVGGDGVIEPEDLFVSSVIAVGNGEDTYLNGANWDPADVSNAMTEVADGIWEITMEDIYAFDNYNIKFAVNSIDSEGNPTSNPWAHNFGAEEEKIYPTGEVIDAVYNGKNAIFEVEEDESTVKLQLDLRDFDFSTKQGAKFTITVTAPEPVDPTTEVPTEAPTEEAPTDPDKPVIIGDVNGDGVVDVMDALVIQKAGVDKVTLTADQKYVADVNDDGVVDVLDALMIQKYAVDKITEFNKKA